MNRLFRAAVSTVAFCIRDPSRATAAYIVCHIALGVTRRALGRLLSLGGPQGSEGNELDDVFGAAHFDAALKADEETAGPALPKPSTALIEMMLEQAEVRRPRRRQRAPGRYPHNHRNVGAGAGDVTFLCKMGAEGLLPVRTCTMGESTLGVGATSGRAKRVVFDNVSRVRFFSKDGAPCEAAPTDDMRRTYAANERLVREDRARAYWQEMGQQREQPQATPAPAPAPTPASMPMPMSVSATPARPIPVTEARSAERPAATIKATAPKLFACSHVVYGLRVATSTTAWGSVVGKTTHKRFSEVHALHQTLIKCPTAKAAVKSLAHLPPRKTMTWSTLMASDTRDATIAKRMVEVPKYLNAVLADAELAAHPAVQGFFGVQAPAF